MELTSYYPKRIFVRYRIKAQLQAEAANSEAFVCLDEALIREITVTVFQSERYRSLYTQCRSKREAALITDQMINDLVSIYKRLKQQQQDPLIQRLNSLI